MEFGHYQLAAFVLMANHVHVLLQPLLPPSRLLKSLKGYTAREANRLLGGTGEPFWQRESNDHCVRNEAEWTRIVGYIESNPVKAGIVRRPEEYRWSSAHPTWQAQLSGTRADKSVGSARTSACATIEGNSEA